MSSYDLIDLELRAFVDGFPKLSWTAELLPEIRAMLDKMADAEPPTTCPVDVTAHAIPRISEDGDVAILLHRPRNVAGNLPVLLDIHGGGYVAGSARGGGARRSALAHDLCCLIVSVDYRLAPEWPHPAGLNDCFAVLAWLFSEADALRLDRSRIAVGGDSAGGGLAAALALLARDEEEFPLVAQMLTYPMLDDRTGSTIMAAELAGEFLWDVSSNRFAWECYLGAAPGGDINDHVAPARAQDLSGLPPAFIAVGQLDLFLAENIDYARRLIDAGVPTELHVYPGAFHGFDLVAEAQSAIAYQRAVRAALRRAFGIG